MPGSAAIGFVFAGGLAGLLAMPHCFAMCGPVAACASRSRGSRWTYQGTRIVAYTGAGGLVGAFGVWVSGWLSAPLTLWLTSGLIAAALLAAAVRLFRDGSGDTSERPAAEPNLVRLRTRSEKEAQRRKERPTEKNQRTLALGLGVATPLFPCGASAAAWMLAAATQSAWWGALTVGAFATASAPALWMSGWAGARLRTFGRMPRRALAAVLVAGALVVVSRPLHGDANPTCATEGAEPVE